MNYKITYYITLLAVFTLSISAYVKQTRPHKIMLTYYDNSEELLNYKEYPHIYIKPGDTTFCVVDSEANICGVKSLKIIQ